MKQSPGNKEGVAGTVEEKGLKFPLCKHAGALEKLQLHGNKLRELPCCIRGLSGLKSLSVQGNMLRSLPDELTCLKVGPALPMRRCPSSTELRLLEIHICLPYIMIAVRRILRNSLQQTMSSSTFLTGCGRPCQICK